MARSLAISPGLGRACRLYRPALFFQWVAAGPGSNFANTEQLGTVAQVAPKYLLDLAHPPAHRGMHPARQFTRDQVNEFSFRAQCGGCHSLITTQLGSSAAPIHRTTFWQKAM